MAAATFFAMAATTYELLERVFSKACSPICPSSDELFAQSRAPLKDLPGASSPECTQRAWTVTNVARPPYSGQAIAPCNACVLPFCADGV